MLQLPPPPNMAELSRVIETARLRLRPIAKTDVDALWTHASNVDVAQNMSWEAHRDVGVTSAFIDRCLEAHAKGTSITWVIEHEGLASGCISLDRITWQFQAWRVDRAELGYWLGQPLWGQGLMTEAAGAAARWGFETLGLHKITIGCVEGNRASQRIIEKLGFRFLALFQDDFYRDGRWQPHRRYELTVTEWTNLFDISSTIRVSRPRPT